MENKSKNEMIRYNTLAAQRVNQKKTTFSGNLTGWIWLGRMYWKKCREIIMTKTEQKKKGERKKRKMKWNKIKSIKRAVHQIIHTYVLQIYDGPLDLYPPPPTSQNKRCVRWTFCVSALKQHTAQHRKLHFYFVVTVQMRFGPFCCASIALKNVQRYNPIKVNDTDDYLYIHHLRCFVLLLSLFLSFFHVYFALKP